MWGLLQPCEREAVSGGAPGKVKERQIWVVQSSTE